MARAESDVTWKEYLLPIFFKSSRREYEHFNSVAIISRMRLYQKSKASQYTPQYIAHVPLHRRCFMRVPNERLALCIQQTRNAQSTKSGYPKNGKEHK